MVFGLKIRFGFSIGFAFTLLSLSYSCKSSHKKSDLTGYTFSNDAAGYDGILYMDADQVFGVACIKGQDVGTVGQAIDCKSVKNRPDIFSGPINFKNFVRRLPKSVLEAQLRDDFKKGTLVADNEGLLWKSYQDEGHNAPIPNYRQKVVVFEKHYDSCEILKKTFEVGQETDCDSISDSVKFGAMIVNNGPCIKMEMQSAKTACWEAKARINKDLGVAYKWSSGMCDYGVGIALFAPDTDCEKISSTERASFLRYHNNQCKETYSSLQDNCKVYKHLISE